MRKLSLGIASAMGAMLCSPSAAQAPVSLSLGQTDVIPTGNDWIALPSIRASDGALQNLNVLAMRYRGLIEASGPGGKPLLRPFVTIDGERHQFSHLDWSLQGYWIPTGTMRTDGIEAKVTYVTPPGYRAALVRLTLTNHRKQPVNAGLGVDLAWGGMNRVTYSPEPLTGRLSMRPAPWDRDMQVFTYGVDDAQYAWGFSYAGANGTLHAGDTPGVTAQREVQLAPGATLDLHFTISAGIEEYGVSKTITVVEKAIDRMGLDGLINQAASEARRHTRRTGDPQLDLVMNRNYLFTTYYAWGRTIDTEQFVGVTSRSNRYYVSAAYWDRDAMLWSFPALLDTDPGRAREALDYALGVQGRNAGVHSRYIDGVVLEDGFELDELVAPLVALAAYVDKTGDLSLLARHRDQITALREALRSHRDAATGLYDTFQDAQDEYIKKPFQIYDNVLVWKALNDLAKLEARRGDSLAAASSRRNAAELQRAILKYGTGTPPGVKGPVFASAVDGKTADFADVPPGSLLKLPMLGFVAEDDPLFRRTFDWLHGPHYQWSYAGKPFGLPGSYRLPFTTSWSVADHLGLKRGRAQALKILRGSSWDGGIITEGVSPNDGAAQDSGRAFATAAGYVAHAVCEMACRDRK